MESYKPDQASVSKCPMLVQDTLRTQRRRLNIMKHASSLQEGHTYRDLEFLQLHRHFGYTNCCLPPALYIALLHVLSPRLIKSPVAYSDVSQSSPGRHYSKMEERSLFLARKCVGGELATLLHASCIKSSHLLGFERSSPFDVRAPPSDCSDGKIYLQSYYATCSVASSLLWRAAGE